MYLQLVQHPLHLLVDLIGWGATELLLFGHAPIALRGADWLISLTPVKRWRGLFPGATVERWLGVRNKSHAGFSLRDKTTQSRLLPCTPESGSIYKLYSPACSTSCRVSHNTMRAWNFRLFEIQFSILFCDWPRREGFELEMVLWLS